MQCFVSHQALLVLLVKFDPCELFWFGDNSIILINNVISSSSSSLNLVIRKEDVILENNAFPWVASTVYINGKHLKIIMTLTHNFNYFYLPQHDTLKTCLITVSFAWPSGKIISHEHALPKNLAFNPLPSLLKVPLSNP